jgi:phosphate starvation-inducible PhoH-like protein
MAKKSAAKVGGKYSFRKPNVKFDFSIRELPWTKKQQDLIKILDDRHTKCALIKGPAGTSKTILAVYMGLKLLKENKISDITYARSAVESSSAKLGFLPGDIADKFEVYSIPFQDKLEELLDPGIIKALKDSNHVQALPINYMRGLNFSGRLVILDESQNFTEEELITAITRIGEHSRLWILGDPNQSDLKNGHSTDFVRFCSKLSDEECVENGIQSFEFGVDDIVRSEFCKFVVKKLEIYEHKPKAVNLPPILINEQVGEVWRPTQN